MAHGKWVAVQFPEGDYRNVYVEPIEEGADIVYVRYPFPEDRSDKKQIINATACWTGKARFYGKGGYKYNDQIGQALRMFFTRR